MTRAEKIERAARKLLDAMDRQYDSPVFSVNVNDARSDLRLLLPRDRSELDRSRVRASAA